MQGRSPPLGRLRPSFRLDVACLLRDNLLDGLLNDEERHEKPFHSDNRLSQAIFRFDVQARTTEYQGSLSFVRLKLESSQRPKRALPSVMR